MQFIVFKFVEQHRMCFVDCKQIEVTMQEQGSFLGNCITQLSALSYALTLLNDIRECLQQACYWVVENFWFKLFILSVLVVNTGLLAAQYYGQPDAWSWVLDDTDMAFVAVYTIECVIRFTGSRTFM